MKTLRIALLALVATFLGCPPTKTPADWPTDPTNDKDILSTCTAAHQKLNELNCNEKRTDFVAFCTYTIGQGIPLHPQCIAAIKTCGELDKCR